MANRCKSIHASVILSICLGSFGCHSPQTSNGTADSDGRSCRKSVGASSNGFAARSAVPDSSARSLDRVLSAKDTLVSRMLRDLDLSHKLTESRTVSGSVLSGDSDLFGTLSHFDKLKKSVKEEKSECENTSDDRMEWVCYPVVHREWGEFRSLSHGKHAIPRQASDSSSRRRNLLLPTAAPHPLSLHNQQPHMHWTT
jgi:hypothetical protein